MWKCQIFASWTKQILNAVKKTSEKNICCNCCDVTTMTLNFDSFQNLHLNLIHFFLCFFVVFLSFLRRWNFWMRLSVVCLNIYIFFWYRDGKISKTGIYCFSFFLNSSASAHEATTKCGNSHAIAERANIFTRKFMFYFTELKTAAQQQSQRKKVRKSQKPIN